MKRKHCWRLVAPQLQRKHTEGFAQEFLRLGCGNRQFEGNFLGEFLAGQTVKPGTTMDNHGSVTSKAARVESDRPYVRCAARRQYLRLARQRENIPRAGARSRNRQHTTAGFLLTLQLLPIPILRHRGLPPSAEKSRSRPAGWRANAPHSSPATLPATQSTRPGHKPP